MREPVNTGGQTAVVLSTKPLEAVEPKASKRRASGTQNKQADAGARKTSKSAQADQSMDAIRKSMLDWLLGTSNNKNQNPGSAFEMVSPISFAGKRRERMMRKMKGVITPGEPD